MQPFIEILGFSINMYWLWLGVGITLAIGLMFLRRHIYRFQTSASDIFYLILFCTAGMLIGAKLLDVIVFTVTNVNQPNFWTAENWLTIVPGVGFAYGGLILGFIFAMIYVRKYKVDFWDGADIMMPSIVLIHVFGRVGCFYAGCCHGIEASWGIAFTPNGIPFIPVQLFEAGFCLLVFVAMLVFRPEKKWSGTLFPIYLVTYSIARFVLEFIRGDAGRGIFLLSTSQWISLLIFPIGIWLLYKRITMRNTANGETETAV
jgi:phosphatidylglycerol:prolipoprotein diacylglycerol transferase